jgi:hypothetical protein
MNDKTTSSPSVKNLAKLFENKNISPPSIRRSVGVSRKSSMTLMPEQNLEFDPKKKSHEYNESRCLERSRSPADSHKFDGKIFSFSQYDDESDKESETQISVIDKTCKTEIQSSTPMNHDIEMKSSNVPRVLQNDGYELNSIHLQSNKDMMEKSITPSDEVISNRIKIIMGLKEHFSSRKIKGGLEPLPQQETFLDQDDEDEHKGRDDNKEEELFDSENESSNNITTPKVSDLQKLTSFQEGDCYYIDSEKTNNNKKANETSKEDHELFTISRSSIENIETPNDKSESHHDSSNYLMRIVNHCQSAAGKLTPKSSKYKNSDDLPMSTKMKRITPVRVNEKSSSGIEIKKKDSQTLKFDFSCGILSNLQMEKYVQILLKNSLRAKQFCMKYFLHVKDVAPIVIRIVVKSATQTSKQTFLATTSLLFSMIASLYPTVPRFNCGVSAFLLILNTTTVSENSIFLVDMMYCKYVF